jgi:hypothetical protein
MRLELGELLRGLAASGQDTDDVEADGLGEGPALADDDLVTGLDTEGGGDVGGEVLVALLVPGVLGYEVEVFAADNQGACSPSVCCQDRSHLFVYIAICATSSTGYSENDVRCILVDMTVPVRIRPRMETMPVNGHFLSM